MPNRIQALVVTCMVAGGLAGGGVLTSGLGEEAMESGPQAQPLAVRAQSPRTEAGERVEGRYCRPVLPESRAGRAAQQGVLEGQCIDDSRQRPVRLST